MTLRDFIHELEILHGASLVVKNGVCSILGPQVPPDFFWLAEVNIDTFLYYGRAVQKAEALRVEVERTRDPRTLAAFQGAVHGISVIETTELRTDG